jgi:hypothetical protein
MAREGAANSGSCRKSTAPSSIQGAYGWAEYRVNLSASAGDARGGSGGYSRLRRRLLQAAAPIAKCDGDGCYKQPVLLLHAAAQVAIGGSGSCYKRPV